MKLSALTFALLLSGVSLAIAQVAKPAPGPLPTPDITLTGSELDTIARELAIEGTMYVKKPDGSIVPLIDQNVSAVLGLLHGKLDAAVKEREDKAKAAPVPDTNPKASDASPGHVAPVIDPAHPGPDPKTP